MEELVIAGRTFRSRLLLGTGKFSAPEVMRDALVVRAKLYNRRGIVVFSTDRMQLGDNQANNPGFAAAFQGRSSSHLIYRDRFNSFDGATEDANLLQTSVPVRSGARPSGFPTPAKHSTAGAGSDSSSRAS